MKVLITGAGALLGQGVIRSLRASTLDVRIVAVDPSPLSIGLYWADERYLVPLASDPAYLERFTAILERTKPDAVLVGTDVELELLARHRAELEARFETLIVVSSPKVVRIADDKHATYAFLREHGFPYPRSSLAEDHLELVREVGFPLIVKPRVGARSVGVRKVTDLDQLKQHLASIADPIVQECVASPDQEYTAGALCFDGEVAGSIVMRRDLRDGNTYRAYVEEYPDLNEWVARFAAALQPHGPVNFQFGLHDGVPKVFEINARFSGTTHFRTLAGFNEVEHTLRRLVLGERPEIPKARPLVILRHWTETALDPRELLSERDS